MRNQEARRGNARPIPKDLASDSIVQPAPGADRVFWVSVRPPLFVTMETADTWRVFLRSREAQGDVHRFDLGTISRGTAALAEIDEALCELGWVRTSAWELGSVAGFVSWVCWDVEEALR